MINDLDNLNLNFDKFGFCVFDSSNDEEFKKLSEKAFHLSNKLVMGDANLQRKWAHKSGVVKHLVNPHRKYEIFKEIINSKIIKDVLGELFPEKLMYVTHSKISYKVQGVKQEWLPHQDSAYKRKKVLGTTIAVFLEDCDERNGTLQVFPESHKKGQIAHRIKFAEGEKEPQIQIEQQIEGEPISVSGSQGDILFFDLNTVHQSGKNQSGGNRCILIFEVQEVIDFPMEMDGTTAILIGDKSKLPPQKRELAAVYARSHMFLREYLIFPIAKRFLYLINKVLSKSKATNG